LFPSSYNLPYKFSFIQPLNIKMSDPVADFLARERDGLAGLEDDIPSATNNGKN
jgi:hypothetical protein